MSEVAHQPACRRLRSAAGPGAPQGSGGQAGRQANRQGERPEETAPTEAILTSASPVTAIGARAAIDHGEPEAQKGLLQALVARIEVESRSAVRPLLPDTARRHTPDGVKPFHQRKGSTAVRIGAPGRIRTCVEGIRSPSPDPLGHGGKSAVARPYA